MDRDIIFLILQYNNVDVTMNCIRSILRLKEQYRIRIIVVDNCSSDGVGTKIIEYMGAVCQEIFMAEGGEKTQVFRCKNEGGCTIDILCRQINDGFSRGNNFGFLYIKEKYTPQFLIVANSDVEFMQEDFIEKIEAEYAQSAFDILGPDIWAPYKGVHQNPLASHIPTIKEVNRTIFLNRVCLFLFPAIYPVLKKYMQSDSQSCDLYVTRTEDACLQGSCMIYSRKYIELREHISQEKNSVIGRTLFYPETNFYYEEFLQTLWCRNNDCNIVYTPNIRVNHMEGQSTNSISTNECEKTKFRMRNILMSAQIYRDELSKTAE